MEKGLFQTEDELQQSFDQYKLKFNPVCTFEVTVLRCRNVSVSKFKDRFLDTPDPKVVITCPKLANNNRFSTVTKSNQTSCVINEKFVFVLPSSEALSNDGTFPVMIELRDADLVDDDVLGSETVNASRFRLNEETEETISFGKHGEVDVKFKKTMKNSPDIRLSLGLHEEEKIFRKKKFPIIKETLDKVLEPDQAPKSIDDTPVASLVCSGGGYRAVIGMCGAVEALADAGLLDAFMYAVGLSGSSWYLSAAYALEGLTPDKMEQFHDHLRIGLRDNVLLEFANPHCMLGYKAYVDKKKDYGQPSSFVDLFGYAIGRRLLGEDHLHTTLTDLQPYVKDAHVPYPLFASLHVRNTVAASKFHAYLDISPFEVQMPKFAMGVGPHTYGSAYTGGMLARQCPEMPLHFVQGMCGCAFSILLKVFLQRGGEKSEIFLEHLDDIRTQKVKLDELQGEQVQLDSDDSEDEDEDEDEDDHEDKRHVTTSVDENANVTAETRIRKKVNKPEEAKQEKKEDGIDKKAALNYVYETILTYAKWLLGVVLSAENKRGKESLTQRVENEVHSGEEKVEQFFLKNITKHISFFSNRDAVIGRTAKVFNLAQGFSPLNVFCMNPFSSQIHDSHEFEDKELLEQLLKDRLKKMSTRKQVISFADAGVLKNVATDLALRPQRTPELMVVLDFNAYKSDDNFNYMPLVSAAVHAFVQELKFPFIDVEEIAHMPPTEFLRFEGKDDEPTVLWFTLSNVAFKKLKDYKPRHSTKFTTGTSFNDFPVFGEGSCYSTFKFNYTREEFDRLRDLMYYNVTLHIEDIKDALAKVIRRKSERRASGKSWI